MSSFPMPSQGTAPDQSANVYDKGEHKFLKAVAEYQRRTGRRFPSFTEVRQIMLDLGYTKPESL